MGFVAFRNKGTLMEERTMIIVGDSPFMQTAEGKVQYLLSRYESMGINNAVVKYPVKIHVFQDMPFILMTNKFPEVKTVTLNAYGDMIQKSNKELYDSFGFNFNIHTDKDLFKDGKLAWCGFTHDYAITYSIHKGYQRIILLGAADFSGTTHYSTGTKFNYSEDLKWKSKRFIEKICSKHAQLLTCNPDSYLEIPRISIDELLI